MISKIKVIGKTQNGAALGVAKAYVAMNPATTLADLRKAFPNDIAPDKGVPEMFLPLAEAEAYNANMSLYFTKDERPIQLQDGSTVAISQIWTGKSLQNLIKVAAKYHIEAEVNKDANVDFGKIGYVLLNVDTNEPVATQEVSAPAAAPAEKKAPKAVEEKASEKKPKTTSPETKDKEKPKVQEKPKEKENPADIKFLGHGVYLINGHRFVDLGLPSKLLWAETNIGAEKEYEAGSYFCWGETDPTPKDFYELPTYKYATLRGDITKYNNVDKKTILDKEDDAAYVNWGTPCRMPTREEFKELLDNCEHDRERVMNPNTGYDDLYTIKLTSKINGNVIYLPMSGFKHINELKECGGFDSEGNVWSSSLDKCGLAIRYNCSYMHPYTHYISGHAISDGLPIRPVAEF